MKAELEAQLAKAEQTHETNRKAYRDALAASNAAAIQTREACAVASESANNLAALKSALSKLTPPAAA